MKIIITETDETGLDCKDTEIEIKDNDWYKNYIGTTEKLEVSPKYDMTDWKSKYEEVREMLIQLGIMINRSWCVPMNIIPENIKIWWLQQKETK